jgi:DNA-binding transcriptional ArsR family regulator
MSMVFNDETLDSNKKLIMLAIGDNANDEGFCYPSLSTLVAKTSLSKPTVIKHIKELEQMNLLLAKKRSKKGGGRYTTIYIIYPQIHIPILDKELLEKFGIKDVQSKEALPPLQSKAPLPQEGIQSKEALPEPSLSLFNHHLYKELDKGEKELYLEYIALRKQMKLKTTMAIHERLLNKYFEFGRNVEIIKNAINSNWKDFYRIKETQAQNNTTGLPDGNWF